MSNTQDNSNALTATAEEDSATTPKQPSSFTDDDGDDHQHTLISKVSTAAPPCSDESIDDSSASGRDKKEQDPPLTPTSTKGQHIAGSKVVTPASDTKNKTSEDPTSPGRSPLRKSTRTRFEPIEWWKSERVVFGPNNEDGCLGKAMGDMPIVTHVGKALPTPYEDVELKRKPPAKAAAGSKCDGKKRSGEKAIMRVEDMPQFDDKALRKKYKKTFSEAEFGSIWSETFEETSETKIISRLSNRNYEQFPLSKKRKREESDKVGQASHAFDVQTDDDDLFPGYIAGNVVLPPKAIKDAERVGFLSNVFSVGDCQPNSLEFALADPQGVQFDEKTAQRFLLSKAGVEVLMALVFFERGFSGHFSARLACRIRNYLHNYME
ncbi:hypothetical protein QTG54_015793 [Skeletonema marinoi]|uniref:Uncharacterized protein n=1 Tax=Skeletonema marinoi TaxID=267567 RepID=A0AAD8XU42_9STRA|nr:hypothetical protein QTG54_015793 [Skeletonema marinoi]